MQFKSLFAAVLVAAPALAAPSPVDSPSKTIEKRSTTVCGDWDSIQTGTYTLWANLWGSASATSGSQCSTVDSLSGNTITWSTSWTWAGGPYSVKSYTEITLDQPTGYQVSSISSIPTVWDWSYTGSNIVADVSYDMFTSTTATGSSDYEIMIWLAALGGAGPISATGSPIATPTIAGTTWNLSYGLNGATKVFSFVAQSQVTSFSADLKLFFNYLATYQDFTASQYLQSINSGTEPFTGSNAVLTTSAYSVYYVMGTSSGITTSVSKAVTSTASTKTSTASTSTSTASSGTGAALWGQCGGTGWTGPTTCATGTCTYSNPYYSQCLS